MSESDQQLIRQFLDGDVAAFGRLVTRYQDQLFNSMVRIVRSHEDARDVVQEAFLQAYRKLSTFRGEAAFYSWLFRIALNASISLKRRARRESLSLDAVSESSGSDAADPRPDARPSSRMEKSERQAIVRRGLDELSEEYRTVLVLKDIEGMKYEQIGEILDCPVGTVRSRIHRARSELREKLTILLKAES